MKWLRLLFNPSERDVIAETRRWRALYDEYYTNGITRGSYCPVTRVERVR